MMNKKRKKQTMMMMMMKKNDITLDIFKTYTKIYRCYSFNKIVLMKKE